jgi:fused signal recognition particle receptor
MFGFLKDKLKSALSVFSKKVDEEVAEPEKDSPKVEDKKKVAVTKDSTKNKKPEPVPKKSEVKVKTKKPDLASDDKKSSESKESKESKKEKTKVVAEDIVSEEDVSKSSEIDVTVPLPEEELPITDEMAEEVPVADSEQEKKELSSLEQEEPKKKSFLSKLFSKSEEEKAKYIDEDDIEDFSDSPKEPLKRSAAIEPSQKADKVPVPVAPEVEEVEEKKGFFKKVSDAFTKKRISEDKFTELFEEIEIALLENNVSYEVVDKIKIDLMGEIVDKPLPRGEISNIIVSRLKKSIEELFDVPEIDLMSEINKKKPYVISFIGVNGSGKTTQLAKLANQIKKKGKTCVIAACDTFRAAAIQQLEEHANNIGVKMIKHDYGADAAAVAFDAIEHAKAQGIDVVLIDTAGRLHSNSNLMAELSKVIRVAKPDLNIFVGESITGNDCVEQAKQFGEAVPINAIILTKADVDEKGGAAISISFVTGKPILYLGTGQGYDDLKEFNSEELVDSLGL